MKIIVGLGNPDQKYKKTRHNIGFMAIDEIADQFEFPDFKKSKFNSVTSEHTLNEDKVILVKPSTYMNLSANAVQPLMTFYKVSKENLIIIYDDIDLPLGQIRIKKRGSAGTHNGMRSIVDRIGTDFLRIRLGIKGEHTEKPGFDLANYVLSPFSDNEKETVAKTIKTLPIIINDLLSGTPEEVMNKYNN